LRLDGFICTKPYYIFAVSEYIRYDLNKLDTAGGEIYTYFILKFWVFINIPHFLCFLILPSFILYLFFTTTAFNSILLLSSFVSVMWGHIHVMSLSSTSHVCQGCHFCAFRYNDRYIRNNQVCVNSSWKLDSSTLENETSTLSWKFGKETFINTASHAIRAH
jgi:hypothetical protein